jgi:hypothetical protein
MKGTKCELKICKFEIVSVLLIRYVMNIERNIEMCSPKQCNHGNERMLHVLSVCL